MNYMIDKLLTKKDIIQHLRTHKGITKTDKKNILKLKLENRKHKEIIISHKKNESAYYVYSFIDNCNSEFAIELVKKIIDNYKHVCALDLDINREPYFYSQAIRFKEQLDDMVKCTKKYHELRNSKEYDNKTKLYWDIARKVKKSALEECVGSLLK